MRFIGSQTFLALTLFVFCANQFNIAASYKSEIAITPAPPEEVTTKKSGWFSGVKNFFRGTTTTTVVPIVEVTTPKSIVTPQLNQQNGPTPINPTAAGQKPPPLVLPHAPLMPLGPRPETPSSSPFGGHAQQPPQWPQAAGPTTSTSTIRPPYQQNYPQKPITSGLAPLQPAAGGLAPFGSNQPPAGGLAPFGGNQHPAGQPNLPPGFQLNRPQRPQPSGFDLSYGGATGGRPASGHHGAGLAPMTSSTTATTPKSVNGPPTPTFDLRGGMSSPSITPQSAQHTTTTTTPRSPHLKDDFPPLSPVRKPSTPGIKEDFPALPTVRAPGSPVPTPASPNRPPSPSAWGGTTPSWGTPTPASPAKPGVSVPTPVSPAKPGVSAPTPASLPSGNRGTFVPRGGTTTTVRPGFQNTGNSLATDDEISALTETLYTKEVNSQLNLVRVNPQGRTRSIDSTDEAPQPLLEVDPKALESPTIAKMRLLFNNYEEDTKTNEHVTPNERMEENDFLDAVMATSVMRQAMLFLQNKGLVTPDPKTHRDLVKELWFTQYSRGGGKIGSSGFEHVFVHEVKEGTLIGLHNWVYFSDEERAGHLDYKGYLKTLDVGTKAKILKVRFSHNGVNKPVNTVFIGTSPELELALYTICFQLRPDRSCPVSLANQKFNIVTYSWRYRGKSLIGSAYPEI